MKKALQMWLAGFESVSAKVVSLAGEVVTGPFGSEELRRTMRSALRYLNFGVAIVDDVVEEQERDRLNDKSKAVSVVKAVEQLIHDKPPSVGGLWWASNERFDVFLGYVRQKLKFDDKTSRVSVLARIYKRLGFDKPPRVVKSTEDFATRVAEIIHRADVSLKTVEWFGTMAGNNLSHLLAALELVLGRADRNAAAQSGQRPKGRKEKARRK